MVRVGLIVVSSIVVAAAVALQFWVGLDYVIRVYVHQDADPDDFLWKPHIVLAPSPQPRSLPRAIDAARVFAAFHEADPRISDLEGFMSANGTTALIVVSDGRILFEGHYNGHETGQEAAAFSVSKSVMSILLARAVERGDLAMSDAITDFAPSLKARDARFDAITISHLLGMRSGLAFDDEVAFPFFNEDKPRIYYANDLRRTVLLNTRIQGAPGQFLYNDYNPNLIGLALERATGRPLGDVLTGDLWRHVGAAYPARWSTDYQGFPLMDSGLAAAPIDLARIGQAMLESIQQPAQLSPQPWSRELIAPDQETSATPMDGRHWVYRAGWWLVPRSSTANDIVAIGNFGQYIYISPENRVVIVRSGVGRGDLGDDDFTAIFFEVAPRLRPISE